MKKTYIILLILFVGFAKVYADSAVNFATQDTAEVDLLNKQGFSMRQTNHDETIKKAQQALEMAKKLNYINGIAEAYRTMGVGEYYANNEAKAIADYYDALTFYEKAGNQYGQAKVLNNIGILYLHLDYDRALE